MTSDDRGNIRMHAATVGHPQGEVTTMSIDDIPAWAALLTAAREARGWDIPEAGERLWKQTGKTVQRDSARRMVDNWERGKHKPRGHNKLAYCALVGLDPRDLDDANSEDGQGKATEQSLLSALTTEVIDLATWVEQTNVGDTTIEYLSATAGRLAVDYQLRPPLPVLGEAATHYRRVAELLKGRQHLRQTRDLYVIAGQLLALLSWASSDLGQPAAAEAYSRAGWAMAEQADHNGLRALILVTQSKTAFWERRLHEAANHAARGFDLAPATSTRIEGETDTPRRAGKVHRMSADKRMIGARLRTAREESPRWSRAEMARRLRSAADPRELPGLPTSTASLK